MHAIIYNPIPLVLIGLVIGHFLITNADELDTSYKNSSLPTKQRINCLIKQMTLEEKVLQLSQTTIGTVDNINNVQHRVSDFDARLGSAIMYNEDPLVRNAFQKKAIEGTRLGIPIIFAHDVIHGFKTIFPTPLAQACSWNPELLRECCAIAAQESKGAGIDWTFAPMIDIARDARWGRIVEGFGEDPYAASIYAAAAVKGYQGEKPPYTIAACLKHFVGYGESEGGRDYTSTDISRQALWETYLPPYHSGVQAGACTLMGAFNTINGVPASANHYTLTEILRNQWNFKGFVVADWCSTGQVKNQGYVDTDPEVAEKCLEAGLDMEMINSYYRDHLPKLVEEGKVDLKTIDEAVRRVLRVKFELGLFDQPLVQERPASERLLLPINRQKARQMAVESMVLLKNDNHILPLTPEVDDIALIGPIVKDKRALLGSWAGRGEAKDTIDLEEGLRAACGDKVRIRSAKGCDYNKGSNQMLDEAVAIAQQSDVILLCLGENHAMNGENASRGSLSLTIPQLQLFDKLTQTRKPIVLLLATGRPISLQKIEPYVKAILVTWHPGTEAGHAVADIITGKENPSGRLAVTFPRTEGQIPIYYNMRPSARPYQGKYQDMSSEPMYWFGSGLSYTEYSYSSLELSASEITPQDSCTVSVEVTNKGKTAGKETVFLYIRDRAASITQPVKRLIAFQQVQLNPRETKKVQFSLVPSRDLSFVDDTGKTHLEPGSFDLMVDKHKTSLLLK